MAKRENAKDILAKYEKKLASQLGGSRGTSSGMASEYSNEYESFRDEMQPELTRYEKWAKSLGNIIKIKIAEKDRVRVQKFLDEAQLNVNASQAVTLSLLTMLGMFFITVMIMAAIYFIQFPDGISSASSAALSNLILFGFLGMVASMFGFYYTYSMPQRLASIWKLRASAQMVPAVLYIVVYMKHTSNLERAVQFAAMHLEGPLAYDFKKIFYDVEVGKYSTIKESLEAYLVKWKEYAPEFVESLHLVESSLFEPEEGRRVEILERSLTVILDGVYEKMLKYSRGIRSPLTNIYMLGIILPTLGLAMLPLASTLLGGIMRWPHVFAFFNVIVPFFVFYMVGEVLLKRPGGYGESGSIDHSPRYKSYFSNKPWALGILLAIPLLIVGFLPFIFQIGFITDSLGLASDYTFSDIGLGFLGAETKFFDFKINDEGETIGPYGPMGMLMGLCIPFGIGLMFYTVYSKKTKGLIKSRDETKNLEKEFANSLFQLGNRLGDGVPAELAFGQIAASTQGQASAKFFNHVSGNITQSGMSLENAVFDPRRGAILYYPSALIATSMRILTESVQKGLKIAARSLMSISQYVKNISKINRRLQDLLAEIVSDMKSNMIFLAPLLSGIVVGLSAMITMILNKLELLDIGGGGALGGASILSSFPALLDVKQMVPPYFVQLSVGIYIIEVIFILTMALVTVNSGKDPVKEKYELSRNLLKGVFLYLATALTSIIALTVLASVALSNIG